MLQLCWAKKLTGTTTASRTELTSISLMTFIRLETVQAEPLAKIKSGGGCLLLRHHLILWLTCRLNLVPELIAHIDRLIAPLFPRLILRDDIGKKVLTD